jgi:hypothetical protein
VSLLGDPGACSAGKFWNLRSPRAPEMQSNSLVAVKKFLNKRLLINLILPVICLIQPEIDWILGYISYKYIVNWSERVQYSYFIKITYVWKIIGGYSPPLFRRPWYCLNLLPENFELLDSRRCIFQHLFLRHKKSYFKCLKHC